MRPAHAPPVTIEQRLAAIVRFVADNDGSSISRVARQLDLSQSELLRLLALLGDDQSVGGIGLVAVSDEGVRRVVRITAQGRDCLRRHA
jgi:hypothetical protein